MSTFSLNRQELLLEDVVSILNTVAYKDVEAEFEKLKTLNDSAICEKFSCHCACVVLLYQDAGTFIYGVRGDKCLDALLGIRTL
jgi:hypothetical protein